MSTGQNILIIEDSIEINNLIKETLDKEGYICTQAFSGTEGLMCIKMDSYSLIILDLMLPGLTGEEFVERIRKTNDVPVLVVSAKTSIDSKVELLGIGADDYLIKPFDIKELKARVEALIRRSQISLDSDNISYKGITLDRGLYDIVIDDKPLNLTKQEYRIVELLMRHPKKVFTKQDIYEYAWEDYYIGEDKTINVHISNIRKKIREFTQEEFIETIWGIGFKIRE